MPYRGAYINLDRSTKRRDAMEAQLYRLGLHYEQFQAVDGYALEDNPSGERGALLSHQRLLALCDHREHLHVLEDDAVLARRAGSVVQWAIDTGLVERFDLLFTDTVLPPTLQFYQYVKKLYDDACIVRDMDGSAVQMRLELIDYYAGASSYVVNRRSMRRVASMLADELYEHDDPSPIDMVFRDRIADGSLNVGCLFPFVTTIQPGITYDTVRSRDGLSDFAMDVIRHSFFVECDHEEMCKVAVDALAPRRSAHSRLMEAVTGFMMTETFKPG